MMIGMVLFFMRTLLMVDRTVLMMMRMLLPFVRMLQAMNGTFLMMI